MSILEKEIEGKLRDITKRYGGLCLKWVCPGWAGVPDRIILLPGGHVIFVETKRPRGGTLSSRQVWWGQQLESLGFDYYVVWDGHDLMTFDTLLKGILWSERTQAYRQKGDLR